MKYVGTARKQRGGIMMPEAFADVPDGQTYEVVDMGGDILVALPPLDRERLRKIRSLADRSIEEHRKTLEGLAQ